MHLGMLLLAIGLAWMVRFVRPEPTGTWSDRWNQTLGLFLFSPLLLLTTALAVLWMGPGGDMLGAHVSGGSYGLAVGFLAFALLMGVYLGWQGWRSLRRIQAYPDIQLETYPGKLLETPTLFAAQVGFWQPQLVISQGLLTRLSPDHLQAVLIHEQAHTHYRDTFWFFGLGWLRRVTCWLPQTETLWQELLLLRELRADRWAAQSTDALLLAEALLQMAQEPIADLSAVDLSAVDWSACCAARGDRLTTRIEALLTNPEPLPESPSWPWSWMLYTLLPLLTVPLHS